MTSAVSKLTKKYQATIPEPVRRQLKLQAGDSIVFDLDGESVRLRKARAVDLAYLKGVEVPLSEWATAEDQEAYGDL